MSDESDNSQTPPTPVPVGKLNTLRSVRREMARLYRDLRNDRVTPRVAGTAGYLLTGIGKVLEVELLEQRLGELEARMGVDRTKGNGSSYATRQH